MGAGDTAAGGRTMALRPRRLGRPRRLVVGLWGLALAGALLAACGGSGGSAGITLYNGQHPQTTAALVAAFEKATGIPVAVRNGGSGVLADQVLAEGSHSPADVIYTENSPALETLADHHRLAPLAPATLSRVPARYRGARGDWVGVSARVSVMVWNTKLLSPSELPTSVLDLAQPRWRGKLALAPTESDFQPVVIAVARRYGDATALRWLLGLKANAAGHIYGDDEAVTAEVNAGQAAIGIVNQYYWYRLRVEKGAGGMHSQIATFAPGDPGYVVDVSGAAVVAASHHQADAQRFVAFLTSRAAQEIIARTDSFEYPIDAGVHASRDATPLSSLQPDPITPAQIGDGSLALRLLQEAQIL